MFERLLLCASAVADLTSANANVYYELGIWHAARPWRTVLMFAERFHLSFDVQSLRGLRYRLNGAGVADRVKEDSSTLRDRSRRPRRQHRQSVVPDARQHPYARLQRSRRRVLPRPAESR